MSLRLPTFGMWHNSFQLLLSCRAVQWTSVGCWSVLSSRPSVAPLLDSTSPSPDNLSVLTHKHTDACASVILFLILCSCLFILNYLSHRALAVEEASCHSVSCSREKPIWPGSKEGLQSTACKELRPSVEKSLRNWVSATVMWVSLKADPPPARPPRRSQTWPIPGHRLWDSLRWQKLAKLFLHSWPTKNLR